MISNISLVYLKKSFNIICRDKCPPCIVEIESIDIAIEQMDWFEGDTNTIQQSINNILGY